MSEDFSRSPINEAEEPTGSVTPAQRSFPEFKGYQILDELPRGGQACVYKALHMATKTKVALKVLAPGFLGSAKARHRFEREVDFISGLKHRYIVGIRDSGISEGNYYFTMEYLRGLPLDQYVSFQGLSFRATMELFVKVCEGVTHAHQHGVIHRDLKPSNILVDNQGDPHILDFGLAKSATNLGDSPSVLSLSGEIKGTLAYMSPEQAKGQADRIDIRTDVYSLGVILYQMLTGQFPYDVSGTTVDILRKIECADPIRPKTTVNRFNSEVEAIILKALEKDPAARYQSAAELWNDIQRWLAGEPVMAKSVSSIYIIRKLVAKHAYVSSVILLLFVIIMAFLTASAIMGKGYLKHRHQLRNTQVKLKKANDMNQGLVQQALFTHMLDLWQKGHLEDAKAMARTFQPGSREALACEILFDVTQNHAPLLQDVKTHDLLFDDFIQAEVCRKRGNPAEALSFYKRVMAAAPREGRHELLRLRAKRLIQELSISE